MAALDHATFDRSKYGPEFRGQVINILNRLRGNINNLSPKFVSSGSRC